MMRSCLVRVATATTSGSPNSTSSTSTAVAFMITSVRFHVPNVTMVSHTLTILPKDIGLTIWAYILTVSMGSEAQTSAGDRNLAPRRSLREWHWHRKSSVQACRS